jgi:hypothetical protein
MAGIQWKDFLKGYYQTMNPYWHTVNPELLEKADTILGPTGTGAWYDPVYSRDLMLEGLTRANSIFATIPKTSYQDKGDSFKYIATDSATGFRGGIGEAGVVFDGTTSVPVPTDVDNIFPAVVKVDWLDTEVGRALSAIQNEPVNDPNQIRDYMGNYFLDKIDQFLAGVGVSATIHGVDTPAVDGTHTKATIECIDRFVTNQAESGATNHVSAATDGDIFLNEAGSGTERIDRSGSAAWDAQVTLPTAAGTEENYDILSELDDLMAVAKCYRNGTGTPNYIGICSDKAMNKIQNELDPKGRYLENELQASQTINGISTRPGVMGGKLSVAGLTICGVKVPFIQNPYLSGTAATGWEWENTVYTTPGGVGHIFLINMDAYEFRTLIPITYKSFPTTAKNSAPGLGNQNIIYMAGQLIMRQWASHAALKYIAA